jgi:hypothetical protein
MPGGWDLTGLTGAAPQAGGQPAASDQPNRRGRARPKWLGALLLHWN